MFVKKKHSFQHFEYIIVCLRFEDDAKNDEIIYHFTLNLKVFLPKTSGNCLMQSIHIKNLLLIFDTQFKIRSNDSFCSNPIIRIPFMDIRYEVYTIFNANWFAQFGPLPILFITNETSRFEESKNFGAHCLLAQL